MEPNTDLYHKIRINIILSKLVFERDPETLINSNKLT